MEIETAKLVRSTQKIIRHTTQGKLRGLQAERTRWQRKATIAQNKLADVQRQIETLADELSEKVLGDELAKLQN